MGHRLVFYKNRSTAKVVAAGAKSKAKKGYGKVVKSRAATASEEKAISAGRWIRTRADGKSPSSPGARSSALKGRPKLKKRTSTARRKTTTARKTTRKSITRKTTARKTTARKPVWERSRPKSLGKPKKLSPAKKTAAEAAAKRAGRPYPNLIDNLRAARKK